MGAIPHSSYFPFHNEENFWVMLVDSYTVWFFQKVNFLDETEAIMSYAAIIPEVCKELGEKLMTSYENFSKPDALLSQALHDNSALEQKRNWLGELQTKARSVAAMEQKNVELDELFIKIKGNAIRKRLGDNSEQESRDDSTRVVKVRDKSERTFYKELVKVIELSDVIVAVIDARDSLGKFLFACDLDILYGRCDALNAKDLVA